MKIDRRCFLSFVIGGAAGTALSPLPWKLTDDSSIWTQMWPWVPVPKDGEINYVNSTCTLCPGGCGITIRKIDDRAVKIEGLKDHPVNKGGICMQGLSGLQLLYGPTRIKTPLKRVGSRGSGKWAKISWNTALSEVVEKLQDLRSGGQAHTVGFISGTDRGTVAQLIDRFLTVYGTPNNMQTPSIEDTYELSLYLMQGAQARPGFDLENSNFILSFGSGILDGWGSPVRMFQANSNWRHNHIKVVQVEPRLSNTAAKATQWIPVNPGTETALALGLAHTIITESLYHKEFVDNYSTGFKDWKQRVLAKYDPQSVSRITGIDKATIVALARDFAKASKPLAICGRGRGVTPGSLDEFSAVQALNALVGNINKAGGFWAVPDPDYINWPPVEMDSTASDGMQQERIDGAWSKKYASTRSLLNRLPAAIDAGQPYPLQALFIHDANPIYTMPDSKVVQQALDKIPFVVSFSSYMDETAQNADLILPHHTYLERYQDIPTPVGLQKPMISLARPVVKPQFNTMHIGDVIIRMAKSLGGNMAAAFPWKSYEACLKTTLGKKWTPLNDKGFLLDADFQPAPWKKAFSTDSGKFEFANKDMPATPPVAIEGDVNSFPLLLIPYDSIRLACGSIGDPPFAVKTVEDTVLKGKDVFVELNPETAGELGIKEGQSAVLSTPRGQAKVRVNLFEGIRPGVVAFPRGLGHFAENDKYLFGKGVNFNELIGPLEDPASGLDAAWGIRAKLSRA